jgi:predicted MFS family arabinose efflux permease
VTALPEHLDPAGGASVTWRARYVLLLLLLCNTLNYMDRQLLFILFESVKKDLSLSDSQLGALIGLAFSVVNTVLALVFATIADRTSRVMVMSGALCFWSLMTAAGSLVQNFTQLVISRLGIAVGEAGCTPSGYAIIAEEFAATQRATAIAVFNLGSPLGMMICFAIGGWLNDALGWRAAMVAIGLPGVLLAVVMATTVRERRAPVPAQDSFSRKSTLSVALTLLKDAPFRNIVVSSALLSLSISACQGFAAPFLMRTQGWTSTDTGLALGPLTGLCGIAGVLLSGAISDYYARRNVGRMFVPSIYSIFLAAPLYVAAWTAPTGKMTLVFLVVPLLASVFFVPPALSAVQTLAPPRFRAVAAATYTTIVSGVGIGGGATMAGVLSDLFAAAHGVDSLRYALSLAVIPQLLAVPFLIALGRDFGPRVLSNAENDKTALNPAQ